MKNEEKLIILISFLFQLIFPNIKCSRIVFAFTAREFLGVFAKLQNRLLFWNEICSRMKVEWTSLVLCV